MLDALEAVAGRDARERVRFEPDARIAGIVGNWPKAVTAARAARLGLFPEARFEDVIRQFVDEQAAGPHAATAPTPT
jgi:hypothetical protein